MKDIKIIRTTMTATHGTLESGSILKNIDDAYADHLVKDCQAAEYIQPVEKQDKPLKKGK